jgi:hypothetical protein
MFETRAICPWDVLFLLFCPMLPLYSNQDKSSQVKT